MPDLCKPLKRLQKHVCSFFCTLTLTLRIPKSRKGEIYKRPTGTEHCSISVSSSWKDLLTEVCNRQSGNYTHWPVPHQSGSSWMTCPHWAPCGQCSWASAAPPQTASLVLGSGWGRGSCILRKREQGQNSESWAYCFRKCLSGHLTLLWPPIMYLDHNIPSMEQNECFKSLPYLH